MVAGAAKADLLADLAEAVDKAIAEGETLEQFRERFLDIVERRGWHGWTGEATPEGRAWRTRVIYETNLITSYAAGRCAQLKEGGYEYWIYRHSDFVQRPRPHHVALDGIVRRTDDPFWQTHYPPNGWIGADFGRDPPLEQIVDAFLADSLYSGACASVAPRKVGRW